MVLKPTLLTNHHIPNLAPLRYALRKIKKIQLKNCFLINTTTFQQLSDAYNMEFYETTFVELLK